MTVALIGDNWWHAACEAAGAPCRILPPPGPVGANPYAADLAVRTAAGSAWGDVLAEGDVAFLLDNGGSGLAFLPAPSPTEQLHLFHERVGVPLASHFIDPLVTVLSGLPWEAAWPSLQSDSWFKFVWDEPQAEELRRFHVPRVHHLPMAAPDRDYDTRPLRPEDARLAVSFVGSQNTTYFFAGRQTPTQALLPGVLAHGARTELPELSFYDLYFDFYQLAEPPVRGDPLPQTLSKAAAYFSAKLFYNASLCIRQRDRFVLFLKRKLGEAFTLFGERWAEAYGLSAQPPIPTYPQYLDHFRKSAINLNLVNGNSDSGLNMRHFEITAAGGFMLCGHTPELARHFEVGKECDAFRHEGELLEKIQYYLAHPQERGAIARSGQRRTLSDHLYSHRLEDIRRTMQAATAAETREPVCAGS